MSHSRYALQLQQALRPVQYATAPADHHAFARRILESPHDPTPSLVYADYLEEQGLPGAAELVRRSATKKPATRGLHPVDPAEWLPGGERGYPHPIWLDLHHTYALRSPLGGVRPTRLYDPKARVRLVLQTPSGLTQPMIDHSPWLETQREYEGHVTVSHELRTTATDAHRLALGMPDLYGAPFVANRMEDWYRVPHDE